MLKFWCWHRNDNVLDNFGDALTPYILNHFGIKYEIESKLSSNVNAICTGSIIQTTSYNDNMIVLGSGAMYRNNKIYKINPKSDYRFVRGPITREVVLSQGGNCPEIYGDPALLLPLFCEESKKEYDVGIVPHFLDYHSVKKLYPNYKVIQVLNENPLQVAKEITKCRSIIATSLHGIIAAHAYGIPAAWLKYSDPKVRCGDDIKFKDHFSCMGLETHMTTKIDEVKFSVGTLPDLNKVSNEFLKLR